MCKTCGEYNNCRDSFVSWIFFIIGIIATIAVRVVTVLIDVNPLYGKIAWYIGIVGFLAFFVYKFRVSHSHASSIRKQSLLEKVRHNEELTKADYTLMEGILCGLSSRKERINYFFIFGLSLVALTLAIYVDFLR